MYRSIPLNPIRTIVDGFVVGYYDLFRLVANLAVIQARYNKRRINTRMSDQQWSIYINPAVRAQIESAIMSMGSASKAPPSAAVVDAVALGNAINQVAEEVPLNQDGPVEGGPFLAPAINKAGGFAWLADCRAFEVTPGTYSFNNLYVNDAEATVYPKMAMEAGPVTKLAEKVGRIAMAHALTRTAGVEEVWGPAIFPKKDDPRNRLPGMVDTQRLINIQTMGYVCMLQPALTMLHAVWRFVFDGERGTSPVREHLTVTLDRHSIEDVHTKLAELCTEFPLLPVYAEALRFTGWSEVDTKWGRLPTAVIPTELAGFKKPDVDIFGSSSPFLSLLNDVYRQLKSATIREQYKAMAKYLGAVKPSGAIPALSPVSGIAMYTDGLNASGKPSDPLELFRTPTFKAASHLSMEEAGPRSVNLSDLVVEARRADQSKGAYDDVPYFSINVQNGEDEGAVHELGTPASWLVFNGPYQGDVSTTVIDGSVEGVAKAMGVSEGALKARIMASEKRWEHLFDIKNGNIEPKKPGQQVFRSLRSSEWWRRGIRLDYIAPSEFRLWRDGLALDTREGIPFDASVQRIQWYGILTPEIPDLNAQLDDVWAGLMIRLGVTG